MHIAVFHNLPSGGAKRALYESVRRLSTRHEIDVYTLSTAEHEFADVRPFAAAHRVYPFSPSPLLGSPFGRLNQLARWLDLHRLEKLQRGIAEEINRRHYDVLLVHPCRFERCPSVVRFVSVPTVYYCHEPLRRLYEMAPWRPYQKSAARWRRELDAVDPLPRMYFSLRWETDRRNVRAATRVLVNSHYMREAVSSIYGVRARVSYHGVDASTFCARGVFRRRFVLSVGSLTPTKAFDFLVQAIAAIPFRDRPPLVIASNSANPPERDYLVRMAAESDVALELFENIGNERLAQLYSEAAVVAYAPVREPFGLVPLEAMACGAPVVATREGGIMEAVLHQKTGLLVEREPSLFAQAIRLLLDDPALADEYGRQGRLEVLANWSWESAVDSLEHHLMAALRPTASQLGAQRPAVA